MSKGSRGPTMTTKRLSAVEFWESLYGRHDPHSCTFAAVCSFAEAYASAQPRWSVTREQAKELAQLISDEFLMGSDCVQDLAALIHEHAADAPEGDQG